jgi:tRNA(Arg) A34 adenosine deaminase TadA
MSRQPDRVTFTLPEWLVEYAECWRPSGLAEERMRFVIGASERNVREKTGGPFAAAVFEHESGAMVALGVNLVVSQQSSVLQAEMVALMLAQQRLHTYDLGVAGIPSHELVTSCEPCAMCLGAIPWSGVRYLVAGAAGADAGSIGFDEGVKPENWIREHESRGIRVQTGVCREDARAVLRLYRQTGGCIYNSKKS